MTDSADYCLTIFVAGVVFAGFWAAIGWALREKDS